MTIYKFSASLVLFSLIILAMGCNTQGGGQPPANPFASNLRTVPPPATFSSQQLFLGQMPGTYTPQAPATTFPPAGSAPPVVVTQPETPPSNVFLSDTANSNEGATLFTTTGAGDWASIETPVTNHTAQTAFQAMDARVDPNSPFAPAFPTDISGSMVIGTSHAVTTITDGL